MNMSYCRWYNTNIDVRDCFEAFEWFDDDSDEMSYEEVEAAKSMIKAMCQFLYDRDVIEDYDYTLLFKRFDQMCEKDEEDED